MNRSYGEDSKKPDDCIKLGRAISRCSNMKETYSDMSGERYLCEVCGATYYLDYEDMK